MANLNIKLVKSLNGRNEATRGKIAHIGYLLQVTEEQ